MSTSKIEFRFVLNSNRLAIYAKNGTDYCRRSVKGLSGYNTNKWNPRTQRFEEVGPEDTYFNAMLQEIASSCKAILDAYNPSSCTEFLNYYNMMSKKILTEAICKHQSLRAKMLANNTKEKPAVAITDFDDQQLLAELKRRGFSGELHLTKTIAI